MTDLHVSRSMVSMTLGCLLLASGIRFVETKTDATGAYAFANIKGDSYKLIPRLGAGLLTCASSPRT